MMSTYGSQAYAYDAWPEHYAPEQEAVRLDVIRGGGLDAAARRSVSREFVRTVRAVALAVALFVALGAIRVAVTTHTVGFLNDGVSLRANIAALEQTNANLKIERSVLSSSARITRIATENYGMVYATSHDRIALPTAEMREALARRHAQEPEAAGDADGPLSGEAEAAGELEVSVEAV